MEALQEPMRPPRRHLPGEFVPPLSVEEANEVHARAVAGDRAACAQLVAANEGIVRKIALSYAKKAPHLEDDLIAEARLAVFLSIPKYDPARGSPFWVYCRFKIRSACRAVVRRQRYAVTIKNDRQSRSRDVPTYSEPIYRVGADGSEYEMTLTARPETETDVLARLRLERAIAGLPDRLHLVIERRFARGRTLHEVGEEIGVTIERTRQLEQQALMQVRKAFFGKVRS